MLKIWTIECLARISWENMQYWKLALGARFGVTWQNWGKLGLHFTSFKIYNSKTRKDQRTDHTFSAVSGHFFSLKSRMFMMFIVYDVLTRACAKNLWTWMFYHIDCKGSRLLPNDELQCASWYQWIVLLYRTLCKIFLVLGLSPS